MKSTALATERLRDLNPVIADAHIGLREEDRLVLTRILSESRTASHPHPRPHRVARGRLLPGGVLVGVVLAILALLLVLVPGTGPKTPTLGSQNWRLVSYKGASFRDVGVGEDSPALQCVTDKVCYSPGSGLIGPNGTLPIYRTVDGGLRWTTLPPIPGVTGSAPEGLHCANANFCTVGGSSGIQVSVDGGTSWRTVSTPTPLRQTAGFWCVDAMRCVVANLNGDTLTGFSSTSDGGAHWSTQAAPTATENPWKLRCDASGSCIEIILGQNSIESLSSSVWGGAWTAHPPASIRQPAIVHNACPDARHCMFVFVGTGYQIITTADAGATWNVTSPPRGWQNIATAVSCANAGDCWIATAHYGSPEGGYSHPLIESTHDFGHTWAPLSLPVTKPPLSDVLEMGCPPSGNGCLAIGNGRDHFVLPRNRSTPLSAPILLSSLP